MENNDLFHWIGETLGAAIRFVVGLLQWLFANLYGAIDSFVNGLTSALGIDSSWLSIALVILGLVLLYTGLRRFLRGALIGGLLWVILGLILLSWLIH